MDLCFQKLATNPQAFKPQKSKHKWNGRKQKGVVVDEMEKSKWKFFETIHKN